MTEVHDGRHRKIKNLLEENQRLRLRISLLAELGRRVTASLDLPTVLSDIVAAACELTGARYGAIGVFDSAGTITDFITHGVSEEDRRRIGDPPVGRGVLGLLQQLQEPLRLADLSKHARSVGFPANHPPMKTFLGTPMGWGEEALGNLYLTEKGGGQEFTPGDQDLLVLFAAQAALAIRNARLHKSVETERVQLQTLVQNSPVGVAVIDAESRRVVIINSEMKRLRGLEHNAGESLDEYLGAALYGRPDGRAYATEDLPVIRALTHGERVQAEEIRIELRDGRQIPTLVSAIPMRDHAGKITSAILVVQDTTPIEQIEKLRSEFLGIVSHELKTPLTAIKGSAATALGSRRPLDPDETRELFTIIDEQSDRLRDLVDNLLDMTRIEAGRLSVSPEVADLRAIIREATHTFSRAGSGHEVRAEIPDGIPAVKADRRRMVQVIANLLTNAAKFSPQGTLIDIQVEHDAEKTTVHVRDHGRGISPDRLPHLFKKFSQVHGDAGKMGGSGLGLAICRGIVEAHGGRIWAQSAGEGIGSTFSFTLPTASQATPQRDSTSPAADVTKRSDHTGIVTRPGTRTRILVADDEFQILRFLQRSLTDAGYHPTVTSDPQQVLKLIEVEEPQLVLLDVNLPGISGFELLTRIREFSGVPVIFLTASGDDANVVKALKMGADDYMTKPFSPSELLARIEACLRRRMLSDTLEAKPPYATGGLSINFAQRLVTQNGRSISLSATEYKLLYELATHAGRVLTHQQLLQRVWGEEYSGATELLRSVIRNLRKKLGDDARHPRFVFTEAQVGYRMPTSN